MSRSSGEALEPTDQFVAYRDPGEAIVGGADEVLFHEGTERVQVYPWATGSVVPDPGDTASVIAQFGTVRSGYGHPASTSVRLRGNLAGAPSGTAVVHKGNGWAPGFGVDVTFKPSL